MSMMQLDPNRAPSSVAEIIEDAPVLRMLRDAGVQIVFGQAPSPCVGSIAYQVDVTPPGADAPWVAQFHVVPGMTRQINAKAHVRDLVTTFLDQCLQRMKDAATDGTADPGQ